MTAIDEKPSHTELVNAGIYVLEPTLLAYVPSDGDYPLPALMAEARARGLNVRPFAIKEEWMDVGNLEEYERIREGRPYDGK